jgi:hypothetical protein
MHMLDAARLNFGCWLVGCCLRPATCLYEGWLLTAPFWFLIGVDCMIAISVFKPIACQALKLIHNLSISTLNLNHRKILYFLRF